MTLERRSVPATKREKRPGRSIGRPVGKKSVGKEVIILRTVELLRITPPEKLSLTGVAKNAGVHLTLVKYYFQDRTRLLVDVARHLTIELGEKRVRAGEQAQLTPQERLREGESRRKFSPGGDPASLCTGGVENGNAETVDRRRPRTP